MIVITADQKNSRSSADAVESTIADITKRWGDSLVLEPERTVGDEIQLLARGGGPVLEIILQLTRSEQWSVGVGFGAVDSPLGATVRESRGPAFIAARTAVERAKRSQSRFAITSEPSTAKATTLEAFINLLVLMRDKRSEQGWAMYELTTQGLSQVDAAASLGITAQSASQRARAAGLRAEQAATVAIASLINELDAEGAIAQ